MVLVDPIILTREELVESEFYKVAQHMDLKRGMFPRMENVLYQWYIHKSERLSNVQFIGMARCIIGITNESRRSIRHTNFKGSIQWLNGFRKRYGIEQGQRCGSSRTTQQPVEANKKTAEQVDIKDATIARPIVNANDAGNDEWSSPTLLQVEINEDITMFDPVPVQIDLENENMADASIVIPDDDVEESNISSRQSRKRSSCYRSHKATAPTKPTWAVRVFVQALKWAKQNSLEKSDVRVLRKLHSRCVMSVNSDGAKSPGTAKKVKAEVEV